MGTVVSINRARFAVGDIIQHRLFDYRGVVVDIDPRCQASDEWYAAMARSKPPKDKPWYHVLVHNATHLTYVAEQNLAADDSGDPVEHPHLLRFFSHLEDGRYISIQGAN